MKINKEIIELKNRIKTMYDTSPYYLSKEHEEIQTFVITSHMNMERAMELMIKIYFAVGINIKDKRQFNQMIVEFISLFKNMTYMEKLSYLDKKIRTGKNLIQALKKLNSYRNGFAHPDAYEIKARYMLNDPKGKIEIRNLLRSIVEVNKLIDDWFRDSQFT